MKLAVVVELMTDPADLDDFGREMVKTRCMVEGVLKIVYVQHKIDNRLIELGYEFYL